MVKRPWDKLLTKVTATAEICQICSSFKKNKQLLTTLVQRKSQKQSKVISQETSTAPTKQILSSQQLSLGLLPLLGACRMEENQ